jgi:hypothetical protein
VTPARLGRFEDALIGAQMRAGAVLGTYDLGGRYLAQRPGDSEIDREEDLFASLRVLRRGQVALLVPFVQTLRKTPDEGQAGGGVGDINLSARYDFVQAEESRIVPGVALLAGVTVPTGRAPESAHPPLLADATGIGAWQVNGALALEQTFGPLLLNATGIVAARTSHASETLAPQVTALVAAAYVLPSDIAIAISASYAFEGSATCSSLAGPCPRGSHVAPDSAKGAMTTTLSAAWPLTTAWRLLGGLYLTPPLSGLGYNEPALGGLTLTLVRPWS